MKKKKWLERKESRLKKKRQRKYEGRGITEKRRNVRVLGEGEKEKAKENFQKKKGREQVEMTLTY